MHKPISLMFVSLGLVACFPAPPTGGGGGGGNRPDAGPPVDPCTPATATGGAYAGFPYNTNDFNANVLPPLRMSCELAGGCHGAGSPATRLQVFSMANAGNNCQDVETFNQVVARSNYMNGGAMSAIVTKIRDTTDMHPDSEAIATALQTFIDNARTEFMNGGGGGADGGTGGGGGADAFDASAYALQIHPILSNSNCTNSNCHNIDDGTNLGGNFGLHPRALAGSTEVTENIAAIVMRIDTSLPATQANMTRFYDKCTDNHAGAVVGNPQAIETWIANGLTAANQ